MPRESSASVLTNFKSIARETNGAGIRGSDLSSIGCVMCFNGLQDTRS